MTAQESQRAQPPERTASFQRMLELEKKYKWQRLQRGSVASDVDIPCSSPPQLPISPTRSPLRPTLQARRRDSSPQQQEPRTPDTMIKTSPQSADMPSLSITIPPLHLPARADVPQGRDEVKAEMQPKTVTFLAPDEDVSDQSSICQSPSWEGYGDKKKRKKEEAELKRREKERAAKETKEAKAARRKLTSRLTKKPPQGGWPLPEQTVSSSLLANQYSPMDPKSFVVHQVKETRGDDSEGFSTSSKSNSFNAPALTGSASLLNGVRAERDREGAPHKPADPSSSVTRIAVEHMSSDRTKHAGRPASASPEVLSPLSTPTGRSTPSVSYPPTASKTYTLQRQANPPTPHTRSRRGSLLGETASRLQEASKFFRSRDLKSNKVPKHYNGSNGSTDSVNTVQSETEARGRPSIGSYIRRRGKSNDHSTSGHVGELVVSHPPTPSNPTSESQPTKHAAAPKEHGQKLTETPKNRHTLTSMEHPPLVTTYESRSTVSSSAARAGNGSAQHPTASSRPNPPPHRRSFKEAAMAAFRKTSHSSPIDPIPPYPRRPSTAPVFSAEAPAPTVHARSRSELTRASDLTFGYEDRLDHARQSDSETTVRSQPQKSDSSDTRGSAASSESSYNELSITVSPITTPDTSRPQSRGGVPMAHLMARGATPRLMAPGVDELTLRLSPQTRRFSDIPCGGHSSRPTSREQPPADEYQGQNGDHEGTNKDHEDLPDVNDSCSRTPLPLGLDSQSFITSLTAMEALGSKLDLMPPPLEIQPPRKDTGEAGQRRHSPSKSFSDPAVRDRVESRSPAPQPIPPKSKARDYLDLLPTEILAAPLTKPRPASTNSLPFDNSVAAAAFYLQEARQAVTSPRPPASPATGGGDGGGGGGGAPSTHPPRGFSPLQPILKTKHPLHRPASSSGASSSSSSRDREPHGASAAPIAKMFVECCGCKFYQDMPARVYECMARPDAVVSDARLGVSGAITTCVRCPWCAHNMSTKCCAGYAAVVYLKEKLHGA